MVDQPAHKLSIAKREVTTATVKLLIDQLREARSKVAIDNLQKSNHCFNGFSLELILMNLRILLS